MRALEKDPSLRFQQANEFKTSVESDCDLKPWLGGSKRDQQMAGKLAKFIFISLGLSFGILGVLGVVLSCFIDVYENELRIGGFLSLAAGGLIFALTMSFVSIFGGHPTEEQVEQSSEPLTESGKKKKSKKKGKEPAQRMPLSVMIIRIFATAAMYGCIVCFMTGAQWYILVSVGVSCAFLFSLAEMVGEAQGYHHKSEWWDD